MAATDDTAPAPSPAPSPAPAPPPSPAPDFADAAVPQMPPIDPIAARSSALRSSIAQATQTSPDAAAATLGLADKTGLSPALVQRNQPAVSALAAAQSVDIQGIAQHHPQLADWLADPVNASVAHDDTDRLKNLDSIIAASIATAKGEDPTAPSLPPGFYMDKTGTIAEPSSDGSTARVYPNLAAVAQEMELRGDRQMADELHAQAEGQRIAAQLSMGVTSPTAATLMVDFTGSATGAFTAGWEPEWSHALANASATMQQANPQVPGWANMTASGIGGIVGSLPGMVAGAPIAGAARTIGAIARLKALISPIAGARVAQFAGQQAEMAAGMTVASAQSAVQDYHDTGSASHALLTGLINEGVVGAIPASAVGHQLYSDGATLLERAQSRQGFTGAATAILGSMGFQGAQGAAGVLGQALNDHLTLGKPIDTPALLSSMVANGLLGAGMGLAFAGHEAMARKAYQDATAAHAALEFGDHLTMGTQMVKGSPLNARAPAAMADALHTMNQAGGQVYVPADGWAAHWTGHGQDPVAVAEAHGVGDEYRQAMATGGDLAMPVERFLQANATSPDDGHGLVRIARLAPDAFTPEQAAKYLGGGLQAAVESRLKEIGAQIGEAATPSPAMDAIHDDMLHQLMLAQPTMPTEMLEQHADTFSKVVGYLAKHTGMDPQAVAARFPLSVTGDTNLIRSTNSLHDTVAAMVDRAQAGSALDGDADHAQMGAALQHLADTAKGMGIDLQTQGVEAIKDQLRTAMGGQPAHTLPQREGTLRGSFRAQTGREGNAGDAEYMAQVDARRQAVDAEHGIHPIAQAMHAYEVGFKVPHLHGGDSVHSEEVNADLMRKTLGEKTLADELAQTMAEEPHIPVIEAENVPYGMGMDVAGTKVFKDPDFKPLHVSIAGRDIDTITTTKMHEITETRWMNAGHTYEESHAIANAVEAAYLRHKGFTDAEVEHYETIIHPMLRKTRKWTGVPPAELNRKPYLEEHEMFLLRPPEERMPGEPEAVTGGPEPEIGHLSPDAQAYLGTLSPADRAGMRTAIEHFAAHPDPKGDTGNLKQLMIFRQARLRRAQMLKQGTRGSLSFGDGKYRMDLSKADFSTFHHELMHYFTEVMGELHADPGADPQLKADYQAMLDFSGYGTHANKVAMMAEAKGILDTARAAGRDLTPEEQARVDQLYAPHEKLAEAHEAYLMRGQAPTEDLRSVFAKVRDWMLAAYKGLTASGVQLSDAITQVFDRLHAGDEALTAVEKDTGEDKPLFATAEEAGMPQDAFQRYLAKRQGIAMTRRERMAREALSDLAAQQTQRYQEAKEKARSTAKEKVDARPDMTAIRALRDGTGPHGEPLPEIAPDGMPWGEMRLDRDQLRALYTKEQIDALPGPRSARNPGKLLHQKHGMDLSRAAELYGFGSIDDMVQALTNAPDRKEATTAATDAILAQEFPSMLDGKALADAAQAAVHTEAQAAADEEDSKRLAALANEQVEKVRGGAARAKAGYEKTIAKLKTTSKATIASMKEDAKIAKDGQAGDRQQALRTLRETLAAKLADNPDTVAYRLGQDSRSGDRLRAASEQEHAAATAAAIKGDTAGMQDHTIEAAMLSAMADKRQAEETTEQTQAATAKALGANEKARLKAARSTFGAALDTAAIKTYAQRTIAKQTIRRLNPEQYRAAEAKAQKECHQALIGKDYHGAFEAKERQRLCAEMYKAAKDAKTEMRDAVRYALSLTRRGAQERIGKAGGWEWTVTVPDGSSTVYTTREQATIAAMATPGSRFEQTSGYLQQINALLGRFELATVSDARLDRRASLASWLAQKAADGEPVAVPESMTDELAVTNWRSASVQTIRDLRDALKNIATMATIKNKLLAAGKARTFDQAKAEQIASIIANGPTARTPVHGLDAPGKVKQELANLFVTGMTVDELVRRLDGHAAGGVMFDSWSRPIQEAMTRHQVMTAEDLAKVDKALDAWGKLASLKTGLDANLRLQLRTTTPGGFGGGLTHWQRIMLAANWGNEGNRERVLAGHGVTPDQVHAELNQLDARDRDLVHAMWSIASSRRPEIGALEERVHGVQPQWVEPTGFTTKAGDWKGGYFPIVYDKTLSAEQVHQDAEAFLGGRGAAYAMTSQGHTKARTAPGGDRLNLDFSAFTNHLSKVNKDLALREVLMDRNKFLRDKAWSGTIAARIGKAGLEQFHNQLLSLAGTDRSLPTGFEKVVGKIRTGWNAAERAFNPAAALVQLTSMPAVINRAGFAHFARALGDAFSPASGEAMFKMAPMMQYRNAGRGKMLQEAIARTDVTAPMKGFQHLAYLFPEKVWTILDRHAWYAGFYHGMEQTGGDREKAAAMATALVNATQGAITPAEQSHWFRIGGEYGKLFTNNMSYANAQYNLLVSSALRFLDKGGFTNKAEAFRLAGDMAMYLIACPMFYLAARQAVNGGNGLADWLDPEKAAGHVGSEALTALVSGIPLLRDVVPAMTENHAMGDLSGESGITAIAKAFSDFGKDLRGGPAKPGRQRSALSPTARDVGKLVGIATHAPTMQLMRMIDGWQDAEQHGRNPVLGALTGEQRPGGP